MSSDKVRFLQLLQLIEKEVQHLEQIIGRFFEGQAVVNLEWLHDKLDTTMGVDQLESFSAKYARLQDTLGDKMLPLFLKLSAEPIGTALENLNRAEKLGLIKSTQDWLGARQLRNFLVHDYIEDFNLLLESLEQARIMSAVLIDSAHIIRNYAHKIGITG